MDRTKIRPTSALRFLNRINESMAQGGSADFPVDLNRSLAFGFCVSTNNEDDRAAADHPTIIEGPRPPLGIIRLVTCRLRWYVRSRSEAPPRPTRRHQVHVLPAAAICQTRTDDSRMPPICWYSSTQITRTPNRAKVTSMADRRSRFLSLRSIAKCRVLLRLALSSVVFLRPITRDLSSTE